MTPSTTSGLIGAVLLTAVVFTATPAAAPTVRSRPTVGNVVKLGVS
jgi:hypothetical protein